MDDGRMTSRYFQGLIRSAAAMLMLLCSVASANAAVYVIWLTTAEDQATESEANSSKEIVDNLAEYAAAGAAPVETSAADFYTEIEELWAESNDTGADYDEHVISEIGAESAPRLNAVSDADVTADEALDVEEALSIERLQVIRKIIAAELAADSDECVVAHESSDACHDELQQQASTTIVNVISESVTGIAQGRICALIARESIDLGMDAVSNAADALREAVVAISDMHDAQDDQLWAEIDSAAAHDNSGVCHPTDVIYNTGELLRSDIDDASVIDEARNELEPQPNLDSEIISDVESYDTGEGDYEYGEYDYDYGYDEYGYSYEQETYGEDKDSTVSEPQSDADVANDEAVTEEQVAPQDAASDPYSYSDEYGYEDEYGYGYEEDAYGEDEELTTSEPDVNTEITGDESIDEEQSVAPQDDVADQYDPSEPYSYEDEYGYGYENEHGGYDDEYGYGSNSYEENSYGYQQQLEDPSADQAVADSADEEAEAEYGYDTESEFGSDADYYEYYGEEYDPSADGEYGEGDATESGSDVNTDAIDDVFAPPVVDEQSAEPPFDYESHYDYDYGYDYEFSSETANDYQFQD
jgi:hypothetical protein